MADTIITRTTTDEPMLTHTMVEVATKFAGADQNKDRRADAEETAAFMLNVLPEASQHDLKSECRRNVLADINNYVDDMKNVALIVTKSNDVTHIDEVTVPDTPHLCRIALRQTI